ncbi:MAG: 50S ribosomal protein L4 [Hyphomicrobiales bacterium]
MELVVRNIEGKETAKKVQLNENIFGVEPNDHAIYLDVKQIQANKRQGTHCSKERNMVSGSTRKLKRQKGTGTARSGDIKSPLFRGGGRVFGPQPRDYHFKLNKKVKRLARKSALAYKAQNNNILVLEAFNFEAPKTKAAVAMIKALSVENERTLFVVKAVENNFLRSISNVQRAEIIRAEELNTYDIMKARKLVIVEDSFEAIEQMFA